MTLKFKDFLNVDYTPGQPEQTSLNAKKRKKDMSTSEDVEVETEALSTPERLKRGRQMRKYHSRIEIGRKKAEKRFANMDVLKRRAQKQARKLVAKKMAKGIDKSELSNARKQEIEKRMESPAVKTRIDRLAKKMLPQVRRNEMQRHSSSPTATSDKKD